MKALIFSLMLGFAVALFAACGAKETCAPDTSYNLAIDPADFASPAINPLWPLVPGSRYVYQAEKQRVTVVVTGETRDVMGVRAVVVRDTVTEGEDIIEDTYDWYATDSRGDVWYFGEDTKEYEKGKVKSTAGSWEAGVNGGKPGIIMHASQPAPRVPYRLEYLACEAEVVSTDEAVSVPAGNFTGCLKTRDFTPLDRSANEYKSYCPGVGLALEVDVRTGTRTSQLVEFATPK